MSKKNEPASGPKNPAAPATEKSPVILHGTRSKTVTLEYPAEFEGKLYTHITVRRPTTAEIQAWASAVNEGRNAALDLYDAPLAVVEGLDPDDAETLGQVYLDFLPRGLRMAIQPPPEPGEAMSASSLAS